MSHINPNNQAATFGFWTTSNLSATSIKYKVPHSTLKPIDAKSAKKPAMLTTTVMKNKVLQHTLKPNVTKSAKEPSKLSPATSMKHKKSDFMIKPNNIRSDKDTSMLATTVTKNKVPHSTLKSKNIQSIKEPSKGTYKLATTSVKYEVPHSTQEPYNTKSIKKLSKMKNKTSLIIATNEFKSSKVILFWTNYHNEAQWRMEDDFTQILPMGRGYFRRHCPQHDCYLTTNKELYNYSHAIIFHDRNILTKKDKTMPLYRSFWQRWIFYNVESPPHAYSHKKYPFQNHHAIYNWSMTYMNTSHVDARYGYIVPRIKPTRPWIHSWSVDYHSRKRHLIAWVVSNCMKTRLRYVHALSRHIHVNIYGKCGNHRCQHKNNYDCWQYEIIQYKFYLAFENSICTDYITEKFWLPLRFGVIPVVLGGGNYQKIAPPHSYIDANNFTSLTALAKHLHKVANNKELYSSYMKWRENWEVMIPRHWCNLCSVLHKYNSSFHHTYNTYNDDFGQHGVAKNCRKYPIPKD